MSDDTDKQHTLGEMFEARYKDARGNPISYEHNPVSDMAKWAASLVLDAPVTDDEQMAFHHADCQPGCPNANAYDSVGACDLCAIMVFLAARKQRFSS